MPGSSRLTTAIFCLSLTITAGCTRAVPTAADMADAGVVNDGVIGDIINAGGIGDVDGGVAKR